MSQRDAGGVGVAGGDFSESERVPIDDHDRLGALAAELVIAEERERRRIASGLHDQVSQMLGVAKVKFGEALAAEPVEEIAELVSEGRQFVDRAIREIRTLTFELSSPVLHELGLEAALASLAEQTERRHGIPCRFEQHSPPVSLAKHLAVMLHWIVRELLWNIVKHANARQVVLTIGRHQDRLRIVVEDDGVGFDASRVLDLPTENGGLGLWAAHERLEWVRGTLDVESAPGQGTRVILTVPASR